MHEFVYADRILQSVLEELKRSGRSKARQVKVEVGEFLDLSEESLNMAYGILSKGTDASGSKLKVTLLSGTVKCANCGFSGGLKPKSGEHTVDPVFPCPKCGAPLAVESGNSVRIVEIA